MPNCATLLTRILERSLCFIFTIRSFVIFAGSAHSIGASNCPRNKGSENKLVYQTFHCKDTTHNVYKQGTDHTGC